MYNSYLSSKLYDKKWLSDAKKSGRSDLDIATEIGCHAITVHNARKKLGVARSSRKKFPQLYDKKWMADAYISKTDEQIAEEVGCSKVSVTKAFGILGLTREHGVRNSILMSNGAFVNPITGRTRPKEIIEAIQAGRIKSVESELGMSLEDYFRLKYLDEAWTTNELADDLPFSKTLIRKLLKKYGFNMTHQEKLVQTGRAAGANNSMFGKPPGHWKRNFRCDLNKFFRSRWEANYARYLNYNDIKWEYEKHNFF